VKEIGPITVLKIALLAVVLAGILACSGQATQEPQVSTPEVPPSEWVELDTWDRDGDNDAPSFMLIRSCGVLYGTPIPTAEAEGISSSTSTMLAELFTSF